MAFTSVATHTATGRLVALCSCGWEGEPQAVKSEAYADKNRHQREHREQEATEEVTG